jgi:hypothetical protein
MAIIPRRRHGTGPLGPAFTDGDILRQIGFVLHGSNWKGPLSRALGVSTAALRQWSVPGARIPQDRRHQLAGYFFGKWPHRRAELDALFAAGDTMQTVARGWPYHRPGESR